ncbi:hypothetical protein RHMOL_Rhmol03G0188500 [Rhododendron molle]|uniref:Uncharacterized protein n=1 Tax=Rhododendron molle TaxID=49168 RepID=A0ACC0PHL6_RHOML|nr:hypothetical protein RHMOL_Rhmol03G0188500 [Rhododendron molle]
MGEQDCCSTHLIDGNGEFNVTGLHNFMKTAKLADLGLSYAVVAIMGPQSSGKSTLLNHLFGTNFREMDAFRGRSKTTKGIWIAKAVGIEPCTIVMDLEGTDGRERGEDDTAFEKQSALFALAISDIVLINMWCHDIGREQAANKPLLKTVFQVMMRLFSPRKTTLLFVIRDKTKTPLEHLEPVLREDIQKVEVTALSSYEEKEEQFKEQVAQLRQRFFHSIAPGGLAGDRRGVVPSSGFSFSAQQIWKVIKENRDLDLPSHKVMVATVRCEEIASDKLRRLTSDELVHPAYVTMLGHLRSKALESFKTHLEQSLRTGDGFAVSVRNCNQACMLEFDRSCADASIQQANWDASRLREKLLRDIEAYASSVRSAKLSETIANQEKKLDQALAAPVESLLEAGGKDTWASIRRLLRRETKAAISGFSSAVTSFELDQSTFDKMVQNLRDYARSIVEKKAREEAGKVLILMKDRFSSVFNHDIDSMPRVWTGKEDIRTITQHARSESLKLLSVMAAIRLDKKPDKIENVLFSSLMDGTVGVPYSQGSIGDSVDPLASSSWAEIPLDKTLITPVQCKTLWRQFKSETDYSVALAYSAQEAYKKSNNWLPPPWAILAMIVLGFNEFMLLLKNPLYPMILFVVFLLAKALWVQMDIPGEFRHGYLAGVLSVTSRFLPTVMNLLRRLAEEAQGHPAPETPRPPHSLASHSLRTQTYQPNLSVSSSVPDSSVSTHISSTEGGVEYSSPQLTHRRGVNVEQAEFS